MMKDIVWDKILSVGIDEIDEDHRKLVGIFNVLNHAVRDGESADYLAAILEELINCTVWHFSHEARLMLKYRYPESEQHQSEHRDLIQTARELQQEVLQGDHPMSNEHLEALERWLTVHILTADGRLGTYLSRYL